jgi:hypothetical protein
MKKKDLKTGNALMSTKCPSQAYFSVLIWGELKIRD